MDWTGELRRRTLIDTGEGDGELTEYNCVLFPGEENELTIQAYAPSLDELSRFVLPEIRDFLAGLDELTAHRDELDADPAQVIHYRGRVGIVWWSRQMNNEFVACYGRENDDWRFLGYDDIFDL
ncbi:hypothetical protein D9V32_08835 [Mycetocola tolaasinivorans]|uniref:Uncharacterized protein n=1 Tax=Mycetocola tolaasinivorans TaxID=76635 RepID=A0A3L7A5I3_9MICO|nr:hypothetical protein [Mycetocola tolaasinivorans]RLP75569.1 hypothetical protein D9V32_08835 [Mycetocola tolaasinivorans]